MINIFEKLKDCPKGTKLYSPICGEATLYNLRNKERYPILVKTLTGSILKFNSFGKNYECSDAECMLFPSKENRDWNNFPDFKDGDIVISSYGNIHILKNHTTSYIYLDTKLGDEGCLDTTITVDVKVCRHANDEEKQKLFKAIKDNGYSWNSETKTLEKLITPTFKVGNSIRHKISHLFYRITTVLEDRYITDTKRIILFNNQDSYELCPKKFDFSTLEPFDKVLVRNYDKSWQISFFGFINQNNGFTCNNGETFSQCVPFEGNEHLLGTFDDCDDYYNN